jgi:DNA-binding IscR family transcriptional regulator
LVASVSGIGGGYRLAQPADAITVLDVIDAIEGERRLFVCRDVRRGCVLIRSEPPAWITGGVCGIHAVMLRAEEAMREELSKTTLMDLAVGFETPEAFSEEVSRWFADRGVARETARVAGLRRRARRGTLPPSE